MYAWSTPAAAPASPDLAPYALKTELPTLTPYALKTELPNLANYALVSQLPPTSFVGSGAYMTVASLLSTYPASATYLGQYARVSDLWGSVRSVMTCEYDGTNYYWRPQRTDYAVSNNSTGGAMTLTPLLTAPTVYLTGSLGANMTITPSATNAWPGAQFEILANGVLNLLGINISGLLGGTLPLLGGGRKIITYTQAGWRGA